MNIPTHLLPIALAGLILCACEKRPDEARTAVDAGAEPGHANKAEIAQWEREIETSRQIIDDLEAAVLMERAKLQDDPNYDQSFLEEILNDQQSEREDIEHAQKQIGELTGSGR